jgi:glycerophosphoryl diester phosphodiesterase
MNRTWVRAAIRGILCAALVTGCGDDDGGSGQKPFFEALPPPVHISHRGGAGIYPESTIYAFTQAVQNDHTDVLEIDLVLSGDGNIMVSHDVEVDRTTDGTGLITDKTLAELKALDAAFWFDPDGDQSYPERGMGHTIPTLDETFEAFPDLYFNLEIKDADSLYEDQLYAVVQQHGMEEQVLWGSAISDSAERLRAVAPQIAIYYHTPAATCFVTQLEFGGDPATDCTDHFDALNLPGGGITLRLVEAAHAMGIAVYAWTVDLPEDMETLFGYGVDGIITDRPDLLRDVIDAM